MTAATKSASRSVTKSVAAVVDKLQAEALERWRAWVADVLEGRPLPDAAAVLEVGRILAVGDAGRVFDADVAQARELAAAEARLARERSALEESVAPYGGEAGIAAELERRREELKQLEQLASPWRHVSIGHGAGRVERIRRSNPRLWG